MTHLLGGSVIFLSSSNFPFIVDVMDNLTSLQKEWITNKENEVVEAGSGYEGGSIRPMIKYLKGAELTRNRVYELMEMYPKN